MKCGIDLERILPIVGFEPFKLGVQTACTFLLNEQVFFW